MPPAARTRRFGPRAAPFPPRNNDRQRAQQPPPAPAPYLGELSAELKASLASLPVEQLRSYLEKCALRFENVHQAMERHMVVKGSEVEPYHKDEDSEEDINCENESEDEANRVAIGDEALTARWAICEHCGVGFDVTNNARGGCHILGATKHKTEANKHVKARFGRREYDEESDTEDWQCCVNCEYEFDTKDNTEPCILEHTGEATVDPESDAWADHDDRCHGDPWTLIDDPTYRDGMMWSCCEQELDAPGCEVFPKHVAIEE